MNKPPIIVGAGLAGLIAACHFKDSHIIEFGQKGKNHQALLRFRTTAVSELTGIPFKKVEVQKEVSIDGETRNYCSIGAANCYSRKVSGGLRSRSIRNLTPDVRYIAPDDFYEQLVARHAERISWGLKFDSAFMANEASGRNFVSTAPMSVNMAAAGIASTHEDFKFDKSGITVIRVPLKIHSEVYQTVYFPQMHMRIFRASITGDVLIIELVDSPIGSEVTANLELHNENAEWDAIETACEAFGLDYERDVAAESRTVTVQKFGKIVDMPKEDRESVMYELTSRHNIFSLGRFATWRNILLDDVVGDLHKIDNLMNASDYARRLSLIAKK